MAPRGLFPRSLASLAAVLALGAACTSRGKASAGRTSATTRAETITPAPRPAPTPAPAEPAVIPDAGPGTASQSAPADAGGQAPAGFCAPDTVAVSPAGAEAFTVTTAHYQLYAEVAEDQAVEMGRLLEAAYPAFAAWFRAKPPPDAGPLQVKLYATEGAWASGLGADGIAAPSEAGGYYSNTTRTAYLFAQRNPYYTHVLLLHEATHQFHALSRTQGQTLPFWYAEGHAEHLSRHDWDGRCVRLGTLPLLSWEDLPGEALAASKAGGIDVPSVVSGTVTPTRDAAWAVFRYLDTGPDHDRFQAFRDAFDAGLTDPAHSFAALVADPATLSAPLAAWLPGVAEPMKPVFTEWTHVGPRALDGDSPGYFSMALLKRLPSHFEARYDAPKTATFTVGLALGYEDDQSYQAILVSSDGRLRTFTASAGNVVWGDAGTAPADAAGAGFLSVDYAPGTARITVNGVVSTRALTGLPVVAGLAISDAKVSFHDLAWR